MAKNFQELGQAVEIHKERIGQMISESFDEFASAHASDRHKVSRRSRANLMRDYIVFRIAHWVAGEPSLRLLTPRGRVMVQLNDSILLQFKKMDSKHRVSNANTPQAMLIENQLPLPLIDMPPDPSYIHAGYVLDATETAIANIFVTYQVGKDVQWAIPIPKPTGNIISIPQSPQADTHAQTRTRIREKGSKNAKQKRSIISGDQ